jgi:hypothetical protein
MLNENRKKKLQELLNSIQVNEQVDYNLVHRALVHPSYLFETWENNHKNPSPCQHTGNPDRGKQKQSFSSHTPLNQKITL